MRCHRSSIWLCLATAFGSAGCVFHIEEPPEKLQFSPDGGLLLHFAFSYSAVWGTPVEEHELACVVWRQVEQPEIARSVPIERIDPGWEQRPPSEKVHAVFSPDSAHVAVISPSFLTVVDLQSAAKFQATPRGERVTSVAWLTASEVVYAAHTNPKVSEPTLWTRTIYRQRIQELPEKRTVVHQEREVVTGADEFIRWGLESWSPNGRYAIFASPYFDGRFHLLDVQTGEVRPLSKADGLSNSVAWRRDSAAALCLGSAWPMQALLLYPESGRTLDLSERFAQTFGNYPPSLEPLWTAENEYVAGMDFKLRGCLIRPEPWEVLPVAKWAEGTVARKERRRGQVWLVPVPGYVLVASEEVADPQVVNYLEHVSYNVKAIAAFWLNDDWAWSPDGEHLARVHPSGREIMWYSGADVLPGWKKPVQATATPASREAE